jgi:hypothetical protein
MRLSMASPMRHEIASLEPLGVCRAFARLVLIEVRQNFALGVSRSGIFRTTLVIVPPSHRAVSRYTSAAIVSL